MADHLRGGRDLAASGDPAVALQLSKCARLARWGRKPDIEEPVRRLVSWVARGTMLAEIYMLRLEANARTNKESTRGTSHPLSCLQQVRRRSCQLPSSALPSCPARTSPRRSDSSQNLSSCVSVRRTNFSPAGPGKAGVSGHPQSTHTINLSVRRAVCPERGAGPAPFPLARRRNAPNLGLD